MLLHSINLSPGLLLMMRNRERPYARIRPALPMILRTMLGQRLSFAPYCSLSPSHCLVIRLTGDVKRKDYAKKGVTMPFCN